MAFEALRFCWVMAKELWKKGGPSPSLGRDKTRQMVHVVVAGAQTSSRVRSHVAGRMQVECLCRQWSRAGAMHTDCSRSCDDMTHGGGWADGREFVSSPNGPHNPQRALDIACASPGA